MTRRIKRKSPYIGGLMEALYGRIEAPFDAHEPGDKIGEESWAGLMKEDMKEER